MARDLIHEAVRNALQKDGWLLLILNKKSS